MKKRELLEQMIEESGVQAILEILSGLCRIRGDAAGDPQSRIAWERVAQAIERCANSRVFRDLTT
jgi:hypothetical protein